MQTQIEKLHEKRENLLASFTSLASAETIDEAKVAELKASIEATDSEINRRMALAASLDEMTSKAPATPRRILDVADLPAATRFSGGDSAGAKEGGAGFRNFGEFALAVRGGRMGAKLDPRLSRLQGAAATYGAEGVGADGGYAIPPDFRTTILKKVQSEESLLSYTDQITTASNEIILPVDETTPWQTTGGITTQWIGEGVAATPTKPALQGFALRANKLMALVPITDELLADASTIDSYLAGKVPDKITSTLNGAILTGTGAGQPVGLIGAASVVSQAAEGGQTAGTVVFNNVTKMWSRIYAPLRSQGVWLINQDIEPQLFALSVSGTAPGQWPAYLPPGGLSNSPYGSLFGRPVIYSEFCSPVGTPGDIIFANLQQYVTVVKAGGIRSDISVHLYFDQDVSAFRFILRVGGAPWWKASMVRAKSALPLSWAVTLAAR